MILKPAILAGFCQQLGMEIQTRLWYTIQVWQKPILPDIDWRPK